MRSVEEERRARFEAVVSLVGEPLRKYAARRTDPEAAQDVVSDAFLVIWRRLDDVPAGAELPWCYAVARNCLANAKRSARRQHSLMVRLASIGSIGPETVIPEGPDLDVSAAMRALPSADREVLMLWAWEDLRPGEIATSLGITVNAVNIRLHRARRRLAAQLQPNDGRKVSPTSGQKPVKEGGTP